MRFSITTKKRFQDNRGRLNANIASVNVNMPKPRKGYKSILSVASNELTDGDRRIWEWNRKNVEKGLKDENFLNNRFKYVVDNIELIKDQDAFDDEQSEHMSRYSSIDSLKPDVKQSDPFGSQLTIASNTSFGTNYSTRTSKHEKLVALATSLIREEPEAEPKKVAYIPAGFERDIHMFQKYNK